MIFTELFVALIIGFLLTLIFATGFRRSGAWASAMIFFILIFLATWAGGLWLVPFGPVVFGVYWLPFLMVGLIFALILAATTPIEPPHKPSDVATEMKEGAETRVIFDLFLWGGVILLSIAIVLGYYL